MGWKVIYSIPATSHKVDNGTKKPHKSSFVLTDNGVVQRFQHLSPCADGQRDSIN